MKILLIDNEAPVRQSLRALISAINKVMYEIDEAGGVESGLAKIALFQPDVVFLDIEMDDGTGFDLMKRLNGVNFQLIFTTAFDQYAIQAFKFSAVDYLMKPVDPVELANSLARASQNMRTKDMQKQLDVLFKHLSDGAAPDRQIVLRDMDATYFVKVNDILYCMAEGAYTQFFFHNSDPILVSRNLHSHEEMLTPMGFIRIHHSFLVNPSQIKMFDKKTDSLVLTSGHSVPVSQRKKDFVIDLLERRSK
jgi:two-component system LytT family response regulator